MRYVAAYLLAVLGGNENPSAGDIEKILGSVGIDVDQERLSKVISELKGKDINEVSGDPCELFVDFKNVCEQCILNHVAKLNVNTF